MIRLRPSQEKVMGYSGGRLAISAVPGSGKTTTLSWLAAELVSGLRQGSGPRFPISVSADEPLVLVVTFSNAGVANFRKRIAGRLQEMGLPRLIGYDVRTLHSLSHLIVGEQPALAGLDPEYKILDERETSSILAMATRSWIHRNEAYWESFLEKKDSNSVDRWLQQSRELARSVVRNAKIGRMKPAGLLERLSQWGDDTEVQLARMGVEIYAIYQAHLERRSAVDFDDLIWLAYQVLQENRGLVEGYRRRWPFVLEDESQDSSPLQEELLEVIVGPDGNWVRVGDPNQSINATFTSADPRYFRRFCGRRDVHTVTLDESGRSSVKIISLANSLVEWVCDSYPERDIRKRAFARQMICPVTPDDPQGNPPAEESAVELWREYPVWRDEIHDVTTRAHRYSLQFPGQTVGILCPTNFLGLEVARALRSMGVDFDSLLHSTDQTRRVLTALAHVADYAARPADGKALTALFSALAASEVLALPHDVSQSHVSALVRSVDVEKLLFPEPGTRRRDFLPQTERTSQDDLLAIDDFARLAARWLRASVLPIDEYLLTVAADLFYGQLEMAVAQQVATILRRIADDHPNMNLPGLAQELHSMAFDLRSLPRMGRPELGFEPQPGRITVATMHGAKGLEWDLVYLLGADRDWFPLDVDDCRRGGPQILDGDLVAEVSALVRSLSTVESPFPSRHNPTKEARLETIAERLRLLYVGITRARRNLCISWSREKPMSEGRWDKTVEVAPALDKLRELAYALKLR